MEPGVGEIICRDGFCVCLSHLLSVFYESVCVCVCVCVQQLDAK